MRLKNATLTALLLLAGTAFSQDLASSFQKPQTNISYLDSIKQTFVKDNLAACVDSLWLKELTSLDLFNDLEHDIKTINLDQKVDYELSTELLKARLKEMDSKSPFNIEYNPGLENIIKSFLKNRKKAYERLMAVSEYYFPQFEEALAKQNVPLEIKYLAIVESALNPKAVSRVGATGLWQFMYQTGKQYNLDIDSYVDERSDPLKASEAAAQYMTNMYKIFGDWDLVLASYNSGPGNVAKAIRRSGGKQNYWNIRKYLPNETAGYVPAFLATMYIYEYHKEHGIVPDRALVKHFQTDTVMIKKEMSFRQIADLLDMPVAQLQLLNPQFKRNVVPAYFDKKHYLRLPNDKIAIFTSNEDKIYAYIDHEASFRERPFSKGLQALAYRDSMKNRNSGDSTESDVVTRTKFHKVRRGDNLSEIADRYNVSMSDIKRWNKLRNNKAPLGRSLKIVTTERIAARTAKKTNVDTIAVAVVNKTEKESASTKVYKEEKVVTFKDVTKFHKVKKGDNLSEISDKYGVTMAEIKKWNKLKSNNVPLGKNLKIITNERVVTTVKKLVKQDNTAIAAAEKNKNEAVEDDDKPSDFYIVKAGDNLSSIAKKYNVSVEDLKKWNDLPGNSIRLESKLKVADLTTNNEEAQEMVAKTEIKNVEYIVQNGENLGTIARKNGVTVSDLKMWNDLEDDNVLSGARIIVGKRIISDPSQQVVAEKSTTKKEKSTKAKNDDHYYVQKGDSLFSIARKYPGITVSDIKKWNGIRGNELKPGMKLKING